MARHECQEFEGIELMSCTVIERVSSIFLGSFGYYVDGKQKLRKTPAYQRVLKRIQTLRDEGLSYRTISSRINKEFKAEKIIISHNTVRFILSGKSGG